MNKPRITIPSKGLLQVHQIELLRKGDYPIPEGIENMTMQEYMEYVAEKSKEMLMKSLQQVPLGIDANGAKVVEFNVKPKAASVNSKGELSGTEENPLDPAHLSEEVRKQITAEFHRLQAKFPSMGQDRLMRKAGAKYNVKFVFE